MGKIKGCLINIICAFFRHKKEIILESNPDMACNTYEVYKFLLKENINKTWKIVWSVKNPSEWSKKNKETNVEFIDRYPKSFISKIKKYIRCNRALISIRSNAPFPKRYCSKRQLNIYLDHGSHLKNMKTNGKTVDIDCDYIISQAPFFDKYIEDQYGIKKDKIILTGIPRNDQFYNSEYKLDQIYPDVHSFSKVIAWVPTFRVAENPWHNGKSRIDCDFSFPLGIPLLYSLDQANELNEFLARKNILLIFKPHPAQDLSLLKSLHLSNFRFLYNDEMLNKGVQTNEFLKCTDAMITDYSGIYYDYLLTDKPIAISLDDFKEYSEQHGFVFENPLAVLKGEYLYNKNDLISFFTNVLNGVDNKREEREKIKNLTNYYQDGNSTERFFDFLKSRMK